MISPNLALQDRAIHHEVYAIIVDWIHRGELRPGDRISEAAIASRLGISRGPVREAISRLDHDGLVVRRPRKGPVIPEFTAKDLADIVAARQLIEGFAARTACTQLTEDDVTTLERLVEEMRQSNQAGDWTRTAVLNSEFHTAVIRAADNRILSRLWQTLHPLAWLLAATPPKEPNMLQDAESTVRRHRALIDALLTRDPEQAEAAFREHVVDAAHVTTGGLRFGSIAGPPAGQPEPASLTAETAQRRNGSRNATHRR